MADRDDNRMQTYLVSLKESGKSQQEVYDLLMEIWCGLTAEQHDPEIDFLWNWLDVVTGNCSNSDCWIWPMPM